MEDVYFLLYDNVHEITSIAISGSIVYRICVSHKCLFRYFYNLRNINQHFKSNDNKLHLSKFFRLKEFVWCDNFQYNTSISTYLTSLTTLNTLKIRLKSIRSLKNINIEHFAHLTKLCLRKKNYNYYVDEHMIYNHTLIKDLTNHVNSQKLLLFFNYCNLERWNVKGCDNAFFTNFICTRLTSLKLNYTSTHLVKLHQNYLSNLLELNLKQGIVDNNDIFFRLTSFKTFNVQTSIDLLKMYNVKLFKLKRKSRFYSKNISVQNTHNLNDIIFQKFSCINIGEIDISNNKSTECLNTDDNLLNLTSLKITTKRYYQFDINVRNTCMLQNLKHIEYNQLKFSTLNDFMKHIVMDKIWIVHGEIEKKAWKNHEYGVTHLVLINNKGFKNADVLCNLNRITYANEKSTYDCKNFRIRTGVLIYRMNVDQCKYKYLKYI